MSNNFKRHLASSHNAQPGEQIQQNGYYSTPDTGSCNGASQFRVPLTPRLAAQPAEEIHIAFVMAEKLNRVLPEGEQKNPIRIVIYTDLDGTLLDHESYSYEAARPALQEVEDTQTPLVFVTSKTYPELIAIHERMGLLGRQPFISENGGLICIPDNYFSFHLPDALPSYTVSRAGDFQTVTLGTPIEKAREALRTAASQTGIPIRTVGDMSVEEFASLTNLSLEDAKRAKQRDFQEGFLIQLPQKEQLEARDTLQKKIESGGKYRFNIGNRFCQIMGRDATKGHAVRVLNALFTKQFGAIRTLGLGDARSDLDFLSVCDRGVLLKSPWNPLDPAVIPEGLETVDAQGPTGWNKVVRETLRTAKWPN